MYNSRSSFFTYSRFLNLQLVLKHTKFSLKWHRKLANAKALQVLKCNCNRASTAELVTNAMLFLTKTTHNGLLIVSFWVLTNKNCIQRTSAAHARSPRSAGRTARVADMLCVHRYAQTGFSTGVRGPLATRRFVLLSWKFKQLCVSELPRLALLA